MQILGIPCCSGYSSRALGGLRILGSKDHDIWVSFESGGNASWEEAEGSESSGFVAKESRV